MSNCTSDEDCATSLICYRSAQWTNERNFCACESWYGWVGSNCLDLGSGSVVLIISSLLMIILTAVTLVLTLDQLRRTLKSHKEAKKNKGLLSRYCFNTAVVTLGFMTVGLIGLVCWKINFMVIVTTPQANTLVSLSNGGAINKLHQNIVAERVFVGVTVLFLGCALLEVSLVWLEIAESSFSTETVTRAEKYRLVINGFQVFWALMYIICASLGQMALMTFLALPLMVFLMVTFFLARHVMYTTIAPLIERTQAVKDPLQKTFDVIERTTRRILIFGAVGVISGALYVILTLFYDYRDIISPDSFINASALFAELVPWTFLATAMVLLRNLYETQEKNSLISHVMEWTRMASDRGIQALSNIQSKASKISSGGSMGENLSSTKISSTNVSTFESMNENSNVEDIL